MNNWHRKMYGLNQGTSDPLLYTKLLKVGAPNEFWLEPGVYTGPAMEVALIEVVPNSLCFRAQFDDQDMNELWRGLEFFPAGTEDLAFDTSGKPQPEEATQRLQALASVDGKEVVISLYLDPTQSAVLLVQVEITARGGGGGGGGWGGGHTFVGHPP